MAASASREIMPARTLVAHSTIALLVIATGSALYLGVVALIGWGFPTIAVPTLRWSDLLVGGVSYLFFAFDMAALQERWLASYQKPTQRILIQLGSALGTLLGKVAMFLIWQLLLPTPLLGAMLLFALLLLPQVAALSLASGGAQPSALARALLAIIAPLSRLLLPFAGKVVRPLNLTIPDGLSGVALLLAGLSIPFATIHEFLGFVVLYPAVQIAGFGVGAIVANSLMSLGLLFAPAQALRLLRSPLLAAPRAAALLVLVFVGLTRLGALIFGL